LKIYQPESGFRYNSDSLLLYDFALGGDIKGDILDIGCGSGIVGLLLARDLGAGLVGIDRQEEMISCSVKNAAENSLDARFECIGVSEFSMEKKFGLIVSNPPFYPSAGTQSENLSKNIARYEENLPFSLLAEKANAHIHNRGSFVFCFDARALQRLMHELRLKKFYVSRMRLVHPDKSKDARLVLIEANKYQKGTMQILPPLFTDDAAYLEDLKKKARTVSMV